MNDCPLCSELGQEILWKDGFCRVILVADADYPGFCRVILNAHVKEMSDLSETERMRLMAVVFAVEAALRDVLRPDKVNLASLGNMVPHLHWHVIPRFAGDRHFPDAIWAAPRRAGQPDMPHDLSASLVRALAARLDRQAAGRA